MMRPISSDSWACRILTSRISPAITLFLFVTQSVLSCAIGSTGQGLLEEAVIELLILRSSCMAETAGKNNSIIAVEFPKNFKKLAVKELIINILQIKNNIVFYSDLFVTLQVL
ncbi:MAG: hypothetical protein K2X28_06685 [Alphaproteobacteria bacterium]|nr:hypothetical protein [Alphaproteobacteria bacterium]